MSVSQSGWRDDPGLAANLRAGRMRRDREAPDYYIFGACPSLRELPALLADLRAQFA
jgi:hypothetical protein